MSRELVTCPRCSTELFEGAVYCQQCGGHTGDGERRARDRNHDNVLLEDLQTALRRELSGEYELNDLLGRGGMSFVFLARELDLNRQVALKVLPLQLLHGPSAAERFEREGKIAASLDHPHIVPIFRVGATSTFLWYTMKRIRGRSLEQLILERGRLPLAEVVRVVQQVGNALDYAHRHGVVHRDVKPANVLIDDTGWAWVCDFGVARSFGTVALTQTGASLGTPRYMAPEQFEGQPVDGRSDQYSLAILVWQALTGTVPFEGDTVGELIRQHLLEEPRRLSAARPDIPLQVSTAVYRAMSKKPADRFPDIAAFVRALGVETKPQLPAEPLPRVIHWTDTPTHPLVWMRRRPFGVAAVIGGIALIGAGVWATLNLLPQDPIVAPQPAAVAPGPVFPAPPLPPPPTAVPQPAVRPPVSASARLSLSTQPTGILFVDGTPIRSTPILAFELAPGRHRVQVKRDGFVPFDTVFVAAPGEEIKWTRRALKPLGS
jgi:eukaryotic-like serine/threonine-protein kinase